MFFHHGFPHQKKSSPVTDEALTMIASWFRVLSEPSRLRMLRREDFLEALPRVPALASMVIELLGTRMRRSCEARLDA